MDVKLKPCPFCGGVNVHLRQAQRRIGRFVMCDDCDARGPDMYGREAAAAAWNRRTLLETEHGNG